VEEIKLKFKNEIMEEEKGDCRKGESDFSKNYHENLNISVENLPQSDRKLPFVKENPGFVVAWLKQFLQTNMTEEKCMIECSFGDCKPESY